MDSFLIAYNGLLEVLGRVLFVFAAVFGVAAALDWGVRTRRLNPFGTIARFLRAYVEPFMRPIERRVVAAGGLPSSAPWWTLAFVVIGSIVLLGLLRFIRDQLVYVSVMSRSGARGVLTILIEWTFTILMAALLVRVISSWIRVSPYSVWVNWAYRISEPILAPLRRIIPPIGMFDVSPIVAYFLLLFLKNILLALV